MGARGPPSGPTEHSFKRPKLKRSFCRRPEEIPTQAKRDPNGTQLLTLEAILLTTGTNVLSSLFIFHSAK